MKRISFSASLFRFKSKAKPYSGAKLKRMSRCRGSPECIEISICINKKCVLRIKVRNRIAEIETSDKFFCRIKFDHSADIGCKVRRAFIAKPIIKINISAGWIEFGFSLTVVNKSGTSFGKNAESVPAFSGFNAYQSLRSVSSESSQRKNINFRFDCQMADR